MRIKASILLLFISLSAFAQVPNNNKQWFRNTVLFDSTTRLYVGTVGTGQIIMDVTGNGEMTWVQPDYIDSLWVKTDSICYSNGITSYCLYLASGGGPGGSFVDSVYQNGDSICYNISSNSYCFLNKSFGVDSIYRKAGIDSIFYTKNNIEYAIKDSVGVGGGGSSSISIGDTITSATNGSVLFADTSGILSQNNQRLFWNNSTLNLGIGLNNPTARLTIKGTHINSLSNALEVHDSTGASNALVVRNDNWIRFGSPSFSTISTVNQQWEFGAGAGRKVLTIGGNNSSAQPAFIRFQIDDGANANKSIQFDNNNGVGGIGTVIKSSGSSPNQLFIEYQANNTEQVLELRDSNLSGRAQLGAGKSSARLVLVRSGTASIGLYDNNFNDSYWNPSGTRTFIFGGTTRTNASAILEIQSTTRGFLPPRMTTAQRDAISSPAAGLMIYNTTTNKFSGFDGTNWHDFH